MKDIPNHNFEDEFRKAFEKAEATPSSKLWAEIDAHLANKEASVYKRKLYQYKLGVAAAALLAFSFIGIWLMQDEFMGNTAANLPQNTTPSTGIAAYNSKASNSQDAKGLSTPPALSQHSTGKSQSSGTETAIAKADSPKNELNTDNILAGKNQVTPPIVPGNAQEKSVTSHDAITYATNDKSINSKKNSESVYKEGQITQKNDNAEELLATEKPNVKNNFLKSNGTQSALLTGRKTGESLDPDGDKTAQNNWFNGHNTNPSNNLSYNLSRLNSKVHLPEELQALQAPVVKVKANSNLYIEDKVKKDASNSASRWSVGLAFTPGHFNPNIEVDQTAAATLSSAKKYFYTNAPANAVAVGRTVQNSKAVGKELENAESVNLSYNVGVQVNYMLSEKFSFQSGIQYLHNNSQISTDNYLENMYNQEKLPEFMAFISPASDPVSFTVVNNPDVLNKSINEVALAMADRYSGSYPGVTEVLVYNTYQYLSVPLRLHYKITDTKVSTSVGAGLSADIFMKNTIGNPKENIANQQLSRSNNAIYKDVGMSGLVSAKVDYQISSKYSVYVEPSYRAALSSFTRSSIISSRPSAFGIGTGFSYRF